MQAPTPLSHLVYGTQELTPQMQQERGSRLASGFRRLGIQVGDVVAVLLKNCAEYADVVHACRIAGVSYCPINWHFTAAEVSYLLQDSGSKLLLTSQGLLDALGDSFASSLPCLVVNGHEAASNYEAWLALQAEYDGPFVAPRGHMAYTSGTTGRPKGVVRFAFPVEELVERHAVNRKLVELAYGLRPGARTLLTAPIYHSAPSLYFQNALMLSELVVLTNRFDPEAFLRTVQDMRIDTAYMVPIMYARLLRLAREVRERYDISSLRFIASTGAPCAPEIKKAMIDWMGPIINETYASSEAGLVTFIGSEDALTHPGSAGRPLLDAQVQILNKQGEALPASEVGLIYVRQPAYADFTYKGNDLARQQISCNGMITLGDMGYLDKEGYLYVCDRDSDMVISGGVNIYPAEVENELLKHPSIVDCAVIGVPDEEYGETLLAVVETVEPCAELPTKLESWLKTKPLAAYKHPKKYIFQILPRDDNGKIAKRKLRDAFWQSHKRKI